MNREQLEHAIRAACEVAGDSEVYVIGSQAILGQYPNAPDDLLMSMEVDVIPKNRPEAWRDIDGALGELSMFNDSFGFYVQGLELKSAILPRGWKKRCIQVSVHSGRKRGLCLEAHDLALSKLAAYRPKDLDFVRTLLVEQLVSAEQLRALLPKLPVEGDTRDRIESWLLGTMQDIQAG